MQLADPEDRALLGSNPSAAVGDGDNRRGVLPDAPAPFHISLVVLVRKAINPSFVTAQLWIKLTSLTRPVCHLAISPERKQLPVLHFQIEFAKKTKARGFLNKKPSERS